MSLVVVFSKGNSWCSCCFSRAMQPCVGGKFCFATCIKIALPAPFMRGHWLWLRTTRQSYKSSSRQNVSVEAGYGLVTGRL